MADEKKDNPAFTGSYANPAAGTSRFNLSAGGGVEEIDSQTNSQTNAEKESGSFFDEVVSDIESGDANPSWNKDLKGRIKTAPNEARQARLEILGKPKVQQAETLNKTS